MLLLIAFVVLSIATVIVEAIETRWSLPVIRAAASGRLPFDQRWRTGYTVDEAKDFLSHLTLEGAAFYRFPQHALDILLPILVAATQVVALVGLAAPLGNWRWLLAAFAVPGLICDLGENILVGRMIKLGAEKIDARLVDAASLCTGLKMIFLWIATAVIVVEFIWRFAPPVLRAAHIG